MQMATIAFLKEVPQALHKCEPVTVYLLMVWKHTIGQEKTKNHLSYLLESNQVPHAQLFNSVCGRGGLVLAIEFALELSFKYFIQDATVKSGLKQTLFPVSSSKVSISFLKFSPDL